MNIKFKSIDIAGFRSIDKAQLIFENQGTIVVKGINEYEKKATSNGSGKSSIFEALIYAIFEETSSGEKDVENRILCNGFKLDLKFSIDNIEYRIVREGKKNKSTVLFYKNDEDISARNKTDTNKLILSLFGISKSLFLDTIFLSQNAVTNLASLQPTARRERLEVLTNTDSNIIKFKDYIKEQQIYYEAQCVEAQASINKLNGNKEIIINQKEEINLKIQQIQEEIERLKQLGDLKTFETQIQSYEQESQQYLVKIEGHNKWIEDKENVIKQLRDQIEELNKERSDIDIQRNTKRDEYNSIENKINEYRNQIQFHRNNQTRLNKEIEDIKSSDKCPTCGRKYENVNEEHIVQVINTKTQEWNKEQIEIDNLDKQIVEVQQSLDIIKTEGLNLKEQIEKIDLSIQDRKKNIDSEETIRKDLIRERESYYAKRESLQKDINSLQEKKDQILKTEVGNIEDFEKMITDFDNQLVDIEKNIKEATDLYELNNNYIEVIKHILFLITKEFRNYLLQNSIEYLNKVLSEYSKELFSNDGDVIKIENDDTKLNISLGNATYESLSGGERTRVNIALLLAQKSLANTVGNISCNLIILDEILGYCDSQAESNVIDLISKELESLETIYMVSHKEIPIGYDAELFVVKDINGLSRIKTY